MANLRSWTAQALEEVGLVSMYHSPRDVKLLCLQRFVRLCAYACTTLVLVSFLAALGNTKTSIGLFMTLTMVGDVGISFLLTLFADGIGRKAILGLGALLMVGSGVVFALADGYWVLLVAAVLGVISPSGNEIGPFRAVEESIVAHLTPREARSDVYAWYSLSGSSGTAVGMIAGGWVLHHLVERMGWEVVAAYRVLFYGYAALGGVKLLLTLALSGRVEADVESQPTVIETPSSVSETAPLLQEQTDPLPLDQNGANGMQKKPRRRLLPRISRETRSIAVKICLLFALDSFASGIASLSWMTYFFRWKFNVEDGVLGSVFSTASIISSASMLVASSLAKRFGNVNTMVFTHLPSSVFLSLIGVPNEVHWATLLLVLRASTASMDTAPRSAFLAAMLLPAERTALIGLMNIVKTSAQSLGPLVTGVLVDHGLFWVAFVIAGALKVAYDIGMLVMFKNHEREKEARDQVAPEGDTEPGEDERRDEVPAPARQ